MLLLRNAAVTVSECFAIYDESVSAFFGGASGLVVVGAVWLVQMTLAASASAPDPALDRQRLVGIVALECVVHAGAAANVYHSYDVRRSGVAISRQTLD